MTVTTVDVQQVRIPAHRVREKQYDPASLAESIARHGLFHAITVRTDLTLIAGFHRLAAVKLLGWTEIQADIRDVDDIEAELIEIDENLEDPGLSAWQESKHIARREQLMRERGERRTEGRHPNPATVAELEAPPKTTAELAKGAGMSERSWRTRARVGRSITPEVAAVIDDIDPESCSLPDSTTQLNYLAGVTDPNDQLEIVTRVADGTARDVWKASEQLKKERKQAEREARREKHDRIATETESAEGQHAGVQPGETWRLGNHLLHCGDTSTQTFRNLLEARDFNMAFADPPYGAQAAEWDDAFDWQHDYLQQHADLVIVTPGIVSIQQLLTRTVMTYRWSLACWLTNGMTRSAVGFGNWIYAAVFAHEDRSIYRQAQDHYRASIKTAETEETDHKGRKPAEFIAQLLETFTSEGDSVIDPFLGSGTTLLVAERLNRSCVGGEINPEYCADIIGRWEEMTGEKAVRT